MWLSCVSSALARVRDKGYQPVILCASKIRQLVKSSIEREMPGVVVLSESEILAAGRNISVDVIDKIEKVEEVS